MKAYGCEREAQGGPLCKEPCGWGRCLTTENQPPGGADHTAAMRQALTTLEGWQNIDGWVWPDSAKQQAKRNTDEAISSLRAALAAQPQADDADVRELRKWLNEEPNRPLDRAALARVLAAQAPAPAVQDAEDAARFRWHYSNARTESDALVELEIRLLNDEKPAIEEVRAAFDAAMAASKPPVQPTGDE